MEPALTTVQNQYFAGLKGSMHTPEVKGARTNGWPPAAAIGKGCENSRSARMNTIFGQMVSSYWYRKPTNLPASRK